MKDYTPKYHARVLKGWSNDPNGMIWFKGKAHLFFQHYPHKAEWGTMHWGHFTSEDFVHWQEEEIALVPDEEYEAVCGCCSGNAIEIDDKLFLVYTAAQPDRQRQCIAAAEDGIHFTKDAANPVLVAEDLSEEVCTRDFRDPKIFKKGDWYYCLAGTRIIDPNNPLYVPVETPEDDVAEDTAGDDTKDENDNGHESVHGKAVDTEVRKKFTDSNDHNEVHGARDTLKYDRWISYSGNKEDHSIVLLTDDEVASEGHNLVHGRQRVNVSGGKGPNVSDAVLGGEYIASGYGNMILFKTKDLKKWEYCGKLIYSEDGFENEFYELDGVYECPDYIPFEDHDLIFASPQNLPRLNDEFENLHSAIYFDGKLDLDTGRFHTKQIIEIDGGFDFYAPQVVNTPDGRKIMIAWKEMWDRSYPTREFGWAGTYTLPRELSYKNGRLYQTPIRELEQYLTNKVELHDLEVTNNSIRLEEITARCSRIDVCFKNETAGRFGIKVFCGSEHETVISYDESEKAVIFDRTHAGEEIDGREGNLNTRTTVIDKEEILKLSLYMDNSSLEVFINGGRYVMSGNVYPDAEDIGVELFASFGKVNITSLTKYDIEV